MFLNVCFFNGSQESNCPEIGAEFILSPALPFPEIGPRFFQRKQTEHLA